MKNLMLVFINSIKIIMIKFQCATNVRIGFGK